MLTSSLTCIIVFIGMIFLVQESPRLLIAKGQVDRSIAIIDKMGHMNKGSGYKRITPNEVEMLKEW